MANSNSFSEALVGIYDAATDVSHWPGALDACQLHVGSKGSAMIVADDNDDKWNMQSASRLWRDIDPERLEWFMRNLAHFDNDAYEAFGQQTKQTIFIDYEFWPDKDALRQRPDYVYYAKHFQICHKAAARLNDYGGWFDNITFQWDVSVQHIPDSSRSRIQELLPHMAKAVEMGRAWRLLNDRFNAVLCALDHVQLGVVVLNPKTQIVECNVEATRILSNRDGISRTLSGRLQVTDKKVDAALQSALQDAAKAASGQAGKHETLIAIQRRSDTRPLIAEIFALRDARQELGQSAPYALLTLIDPGNTASISTALLATGYKLTAAESSVCRHLVNGYTNPQIAAERDVSTDTIKSQVASIYAKTGIASRSELIRLAAKTSPPVSRGGA